MSTHANSSRREMDSVLSAIKKMVRKETKDRFAGTNVEPELTRPAKRKSSLPSKIFVLQPWMRVDKPESGFTRTTPPKPDPSRISDDSFAVANTAIDEDLLRDMVRDVVREHMEGAWGQKLVQALKSEVAKSLPKA